LVRYFPFCHLLDINIMEDTKGQYHYTKQASRDYEYNEQYTRNLNYDRHHPPATSWQYKDVKTSQQYKDVNQHEGGQNYNSNQCNNDDRRYKGHNDGYQKYDSD